jgi:hypothetical protein
VIAIAASRRDGPLVTLALGVFCYYRTDQAEAGKITGAMSTVSGLAADTRKERTPLTHMQGCVQTQSKSLAQSKPGT